MRILHLPYNIASQISITVRALRDIGVEAKGLTFGNSPIQDNDFINTFESTSPRSNLIRWLNQNSEVFSAIRWADLIHWHFGLVNDHTLHTYLLYIYLLRKPAIIEFWGSDIRIPDIASRDNPYLKKMLLSDRNDYKISLQGSIKAQKLFAKYRFNCLVPGSELIPYVDTNIFPSFFNSEARLILSDFQPKYPDPTNPRPVVVHTPSRLTVKGTTFVLQAVEQLKTEYDFEFKLIHNMPRKDALAMVRDCDIMLDQFILGSFGTAALEAMAFGKPTICYIKSSVLSDLPNEFPIINANPDNLTNVLKKLLDDGLQRKEVGQHSRHYIEKYHDAYQIARHFVQIYQQVIEKNKKISQNSNS